MDLMYAMIGIGLAFFALLISIIGIAEMLGGEWLEISQGLVQFMPYIVVFGLAFFILIGLMERR